MAHLKPFKVSGVNTFLSEKISPLKCLVSFLEEKDFIWEKYREQFKLLKSLSEKNINTYTTTSVGRFFDAVSALVLMYLGNCDIDIINPSYEGEAPVFLEQIADKNVSDIYDYSVSDNIINEEIIINQILEDMNRGEKASRISAKFHNTVSGFTAYVCKNISNDMGIKNVCLSGGVFQNIYLVNRLCQDLIQYGLNPDLCNIFPTNDGGISFGQAVYGKFALQI